MLSKPLRMRRARDFALLSQKGWVVFGPFFTLRFRPSQEQTKVGFVVSTKVYKNAVDRNRTKRRLREALRSVQDQWPERMDLLFIAKTEARYVPFQELIASVIYLFGKIPEALSKPPQARKNPKAKRKSSIVYKSS